MNETADTDADAAEAQELLLAAVASSIDESDPDGLGLLPSLYASVQVSGCWVLVVVGQCSATTSYLLHY